MQTSFFFCLSSSAVKDAELDKEQFDPIKYGSWPKALLQFYCASQQKKSIITHGKPEKTKMHSCKRESLIQLLEKHLLHIQM